MPKLIDAVCETCGKKFKARAVRVAVGMGKFCSKKCYGISKRGLIDSRSPSWKGDKVGYFGLHVWINKKLGRPKRCEFCGTTNPKIGYHWANVSGLYKREINDFKRLCTACHNRFDLHTRPRGESCYNSILTEKDVREIRRLYSENVPRKEIAKMFNVKYCTIYSITKRYIWTHI